MIKRYIEVECDNCGAVLSFQNMQIFDVYTSVRSRNWAVSKNRTYTFCPKCKIKVTSVGRNGVNKLLPFSAKKQRHDDREKQYLDEIARKDMEIYLQECKEFEEMNK